MQEFKKKCCYTRYLRLNWWQLVYRRILKAFKLKAVFFFYESYPIRPQLLSQIKNDLKNSISLKKSLRLEAFFYLLGTYKKKVWQNTPPWFQLMPFISWWNLKRVFFLQKSYYFVTRYILSIGLIRDARNQMESKFLVFF